MGNSELNRRRILKGGLAAGSLFLPAPYAWVWAQSDGTMKLLRAPKIALVIGNGNYKGSPLKNPTNDAKTFAEALKASGFDVTLQLDLGKADLANAVEVYVHTLGEKKCVGLFYYAGHGIQLAWRNYMLPVDIDIGGVDDIPKQAVEVKRLLDGLIKAANPMNLIVLDACRNNPFDSLKGIDQKGLSQMDAPQDTLLAYATSPGNVASDGDGANGLYTENLLREMKVPEVKVEDVFKRVRLAVRRKSNGAQIPWESTSLEEDFWFIPPKVVKKPSEEELIQQFEEELAIWEKIKNSKETTQLEDFLRRYPSGKFSEIAQFRLERIMAQLQKQLAETKAVEQAALEKAAAEKAAAEKALAEKAAADKLAADKAATEKTAADMLAAEKLTIASISERKKQEESARVAQAVPVPNVPIRPTSIASNPFSKGTGVVDVNYKIGDSYTYRIVNLLRNAETERFTEKVTQVTEEDVIFNNGRKVLDLLGNDRKSQSADLLTDAQFFPSVYAVGMKWSTRFRYTRRLHPGEEAVRAFDMRIATRENVTVAAGTFNAFRVEGRGSSLANGAQQTRVYWVAPDVVRRPIAYEIVTMERRNRGYDGEPQRFELVSFSESR